MVLFPATTTGVGDQLVKNFHVLLPWLNMTDGPCTENMALAHRVYVFLGKLLYENSPTGTVVQYFLWYFFPAQ